MDYIDEQKRYPKASARFIKKWFDEHIAWDIEEGIEEMEDALSVSSERSPRIQDSTSVTSDESITPEDEDDEFSGKHALPKTVAAEARSSST